MIGGLLAAPFESIAGQGTRVIGVLIDSLRLPTTEGASRLGEQFVRVRGATVSFGSRRATTDSLGRFTFIGVEPGRHRIAFHEPWLDSVDLPALTGDVTIAAGDTLVAVIIATPSLRTYLRMQCDSLPEEGLGVLLGSARDAAGAPLAAVRVRAQWFELRTDRRGTTRRAVEASATARESGGFVLCGVPSEGEINLDLAPALSAGASASERRRFDSVISVVVTMSSPVSRRDLLIGDPNEQVRVRGVVKDSGGRAVRGASITPRGSEQVLARTDSAGTFLLVLAGRHTQQLAVRALGFQPELFDVDPVGIETDVGTLAMRVVMTGLDTVKVVGSRDLFDWRTGFEERRKVGLGAFITEEQLKRMPRVTNNQIAQIARRIRVERQGIKLASGTGACWPRWFVDGHDEGKEVDPRGRGNGAGWAQAILDRAKSIEVYSAAQAPPRYNDFDGCGAIVVWTR